jgi:hypothetical protein
MNLKNLEAIRRIVNSPEEADPKAEVAALKAELSALKLENVQLQQTLRLAHEYVDRVTLHTMGIMGAVPGPTDPTEIN